MEVIMSKRDEVIKNIKLFKDNKIMVRDTNDPFDIIMTDEEMTEWDKHNDEFEITMRETAKEYNIDYDTV